jgi:two-component system response regulator NreC
MSHTSSLIDPEIHPLRVLLVDDSAQVRQELGQLLELSGLIHIVGEAADGQEAIRLAAKLLPQVIVMDLEMPGLDGYAATRQIKDHQPALRVVILSVYTRPDAERRAREAGADSFVVKGASYHVLLSAILGKDTPPKSFE